MYVNKLFEVILCYVTGRTISASVSDASAQNCCKATQSLNRKDPKILPTLWAPFQGRTSALLLLLHGGRKKYVGNTSLDKFFHNVLYCDLTYIRTVQIVLQLTILKQL